MCSMNACMVLVNYYSYLPIWILSWGGLSLLMAMQAVSVASEELFGYCESGAERLTEIEWVEKGEESAYPH